MVISFNPFAGLVETSAHPHARGRRTTRKQKLLDTFKVFFGNFNSKDMKNSHAGVFDYIPLLGIIPLLDKAHDYLVRRNGNESNAVSAIKGLLTSLQLLFVLPRIVFAAVLTTLCVIPVCIIHAVMSSEGDEIKKEINSFAPLKTDADAEADTTAITFAQLLENENTCLEEICDIKTTPLLDNPNIKTLQFFAPNVQTQSDKENEDNLLLEEKTQPSEEETQHEVLQFNLDTTRHSRFFQALKELNVGGILSKQEEEERNGYWL